MNAFHFGAGDHVRHLKTGGEYEVLALGKLEATLEPVVVYRSLATSDIWVRPTIEFCDGRFVAVA